MWSKDQALAIVNALCEGTKARTIAWGDTAEENTFRALLKNGIVRISRHDIPFGQANDGVVPITNGLPFSTPLGFQPYGPFIFSLFVLDNQSHEVTRFVAANRDEAAPLETLWDLAFKAVRNPEKRLENILAEITGSTRK